MGCTHPFGIDPIRDKNGKLIGGRCPSCKSIAFVGETFWQAARRNLGRKLRGSRTSA